METKLKVVLLLALASANAGVLPAPKILEGPSSKTTIIGPDGSNISAFSPGGKIVLDEHPGPALQGAPEVVAVAGVAQPLPVVSTQVVEEIAPVISNIKPDDVHEIIVEHAEGTELSESATTENITQVEATTIGVVSSTDELSTEAEDTSGSLTVETLNGTPFNAISLVKEVHPVVKATEPQHILAYIPENSFEEKILG